MIADRILLILDLDETLIYGTEEPLDRLGDFVVEPYTIYKRPFLEPFLRHCAGLFDLAVWSAASTPYVEAVVQHVLPPDIPLALLWSERRCTRHLDPETREQVFLKDLKKVKRHYGNLVPVPGYRGSATDTVLLLLGRYLETLHHVSDVRGIDKRDWIVQSLSRTTLCESGEGVHPRW